MATKTEKMVDVPQMQGMPEGMGQPQMLTPEQMMEQQEAMEFQKMASKTELKIRRANIIMNGLAVGGDVVAPLFDEKTRESLQAKLAEILKSI